MRISILYKPVDLLYHFIKKSNSSTKNAIDSRPYYLLYIMRHVLQEHAVLFESCYHRAQLTLFISALMK